MAGPRPSRVVVVDDHPIVLRGVVDMLSQAPDFAVTSTACTAREAGAAVRANRPDLVVLDLRLGDDLAADLIEDLAAAAPEARIVILTAYDDGELIRLCLQRGAVGVLLKDATSLDLVAALTRVIAGDIVVDPRLGSRGFRQGEQARYAEGGFERLSEREYEILRLLASGLNTREMATKMQLMPNTVRSYTQAVLGKLQAKNRVMALATARRLRLI